jgi:ACS family glucarate transporter-like MFS transporter
MPVLFKEISADLGLNLVQVGWIWGLLSLSGLLTVFISGLLADRFGAKRMIIFACSMAGLAGASRGLSNNFATLTITTFLFGLLVVFIVIDILKTVATWFQSRHLGLANGTLATGMGVGFTIGSMFSATLLSPMLGSWRGVLFLYGGISLFFAMLWFITTKEQQPEGISKASDRVTTREAIYHVLRNKNVWVLSIALLGYTGCTEGICGYLPLYLREFKEWLPASADGTLATFNGVSTLAAIPMSLLSDKLGRRKLLLISISIVTIIGVGLLSIADGMIIWIIIIFVGMGRDAFMALVIASTIESEGIGVLYTGTALGLIQTISRIGPFISPPIGNTMASSSGGFPFIIWSVFGVIALLCLPLIRETVHRRV